MYFCTTWKIINLLCVYVSIHISIIRTVFIYL
jgi:hypothetical protein